MRSFSRSCESPERSRDYCAGVSAASFSASRDARPTLRVATAAAHHVDTDTPYPKPRATTPEVALGYRCYRLRRHHNHCVFLAKRSFPHVVSVQNSIMTLIASRSFIAR